MDKCSVFSIHPSAGTDQPDSVMHGIPDSSAIGYSRVSLQVMIGKWAPRPLLAPPQLLHLSDPHQALPVTLQPSSAIPGPGQSPLHISTPHTEELPCSPSSWRGARPGTLGGSGPRQSLQSSVSWCSAAGAGSSPSPAAHPCVSGRERGRQAQKRAGRKGEVGGWEV